MTNEQLTAAWIQRNGAYSPLTEEAVFAFIRYLIAAEREACAKECERVALRGDKPHEWRAAALECKSLIMRRCNS